MQATRHNIQKIIERAEQQCQANGARLTSKRKQVLLGLLHSPKALSAYELTNYCKTEFDEPIPAMSVYRILSFFEDNQLVHKLNLSNKYIPCAHITCDHAHVIAQFLICGQCQRVKEISIGEATVNELREHVKQAGFYLTDPQLEMNCICEECRFNVA